MRCAVTTSNDQKFIHLGELPRAISAGARRALPADRAAEGARIVGVEALLRWTHPARGAIPPRDVRSGRRADRADGHSSASSCCAARLSDARRWPGLYIAVNLSPVQVRDPALVELVSASAGRRTTSRRRG